MAITGSWKNGQAVIAGAAKWGTGVNPIHGTNTGDGRNIAPAPGLNTIGDTYTDNIDPVDGYCDEDSTSTLFGYGFQTGTAERPSVGTEDNRSDADDFPSWGYANGIQGIPAGTVIRTVNQGADATNTYKQQPSENVSMGWLNKQVGSVEDSKTADDSQLYMQTSMTQRDKVRAGSQVPTGRANTFDAPIASRIPGQRLKFYSGGQRHADMEPKAQDMVIRPFWNRNAGTGYRQWMLPNEMYVSDPMNRVSPPDPYVGEDVPADDSYGYTPEDAGYQYG